MSFALSVVAAALSFWGIVTMIAGNAMNIDHPRTAEAMAVVKRMEIGVFWCCVIGIPIVASLLARLLDVLLKKKYAPSHDEPVATVVAGPTRQRGFERWILWLVLPCLVYVAIPRNPLHRPIDFVDEGLRLQPLEQYWHGRAPYKDIFFIYGPGIQLVQPWISTKLFGDTLLAHRKLEWLVDALAVVALYFVALAAVRRAASLVFFLYLILGWSASLLTPRCLFVIATLALFLHGVRWESPRRRNLIVLSGIACSLGLFYSLDTGLIGLAAVGSFLAFTLVKRWFTAESSKDPIIDGAAFATGNLLVVLPAALWLVHLGAFGRLFSDIAMIRTGMTDLYGKPTRPLTESVLGFVRDPFLLFSWRGTSLRWWMPLFIYVFFLARQLYRLPRKSTDTDNAALLLSLAGVFFFRVTMARSDLDHWLKGAIPFWILLTLLFDRAYDAIRRPSGGSTNRPWPPRAAALAGFVLCVAFAVSSHRSFWWSTVPFNASQLRQIILSRRTALADRFDGLSPEEADSNHARELEQTVRRFALDGEPVFLFCSLDLLYYLADVTDPTRRDFWLESRTNIPETIDDLERSHPKLIVIDLSRDYDRYVYQQPLVRYIANHFERAAEVGHYRFLTPAKKNKGRGSSS